MQNQNNQVDDKKIYFDNNLRFLLAKAQMSQEALSQELGINRALVNAYVKKGSEPKYERLVKIANIFKVNVHDLLLTDLSEGKDIPPMPNGRKRYDYQQQQQQPSLFDMSEQANEVYSELHLLMRKIEVLKSKIAPASSETEAEFALNSGSPDGNLNLYVLRPTYVAA